MGKKELIEEAFGYPLEWELPENKMSRIKIESNETNFFDENEWGQRNMFSVEILPKFKEGFDPFVKELK